MKKFLSMAVLLLPALLFAQGKSPGFITKYHYLKISPTVLLMADATDNLVRENAFVPALFGTIGGKISRYTALGFCTGFFTLKGSKSTVIPLGAELTVTDFRAKKAFPVITAQWLHTSFKEQYWATGGRYSSKTYNITGKQMYSISGGVAFRVFKTQKMMLTAGYSKLKSNTVITTSTASSSGDYSYTSYAKDHQNMLVLSLGLVF